MSCSNPPLSGTTTVAPDATSPVASRPSALPIASGSGPSAARAIRISPAPTVVLSKPVGGIVFPPRAVHHIRSGRCAIRSIRDPIAGCSGGSRSNDRFPHRQFRCARGRHRFELPGHLGPHAGDPAIHLHARPAEALRRETPARRDGGAPRPLWVCSQPCSSSTASRTHRCARWPARVSRNRPAALFDPQPSVCTRATETRHVASRAADSRRGPRR